MNAIDLLLAQHREIENLFGQCKKASGEDKLELFHAIADLLVLHTSIEEEHFYPAAATGGIPLHDSHCATNCTDRCARSSSMSSPGRGWPHAEFVHTPGHVILSSARRVVSTRPSSSNT